MFRDSILWGNSRVPVTLNKVIIRMRVKLKSLDVSRFDPLGKPEGSSHPKHGYHSYEGQIEVTQNFTTEARFPYAEREFRNVGEGIEMGQSQYTANVLRNLNAIGEWKFILGLAICFYRGPRRLVCRFLSELIVGITLIRLPKI
jgi:hypothetical protein